MISYAINGINGYDDIMIRLAMITRFPNKLIVNSGQFMVPWVGVLAQDRLPGPEALALMRLSPCQVLSPCQPLRQGGLQHPLDAQLHAHGAGAMADDALQGYRSQPTGTDATDPLRLWSTATAKATAPLAEKGSCVSRRWSRESASWSRGTRITSCTATRTSRTGSC